MKKEFDIDEYASKKRKSYSSICEYHLIIYDKIKKKKCNDIFFDNKNFIIKCLVNDKIYSFTEDNLRIFNALGCNLFEHYDILIQDKLKQKLLRP